MPLKITPLTPAVGAEICGVDLGAALDSSTIEAIYRALLDRLVLFFRGQALAPRDLVRFGAQFGALDRPHPVYPQVEGFAEIVELENDGARPPDTNEWHTDLTFYRDPPFASILHAVDIPALGGDTLWASMYAAYDALPDDIKKQIAPLSAVRSVSVGRHQ